jgi:biopolymer transport protein ExbD
MAEATEEGLGSKWAVVPMIVVVVVVLIFLL